MISGSPYPKPPIFYGIPNLQASWMWSQSGIEALFTKDLWPTALSKNFIHQHKYTLT